MLMWLFFTNFAHLALGQGPPSMEVEFTCPRETMLLKGIASKAPFFGDALQKKCEDFHQKIYKDERVVYQFDLSEDASEGISAKCANEGDIVVAFTLQLSNDRVTKISLECSPLSDPDSLDEMYNRTSDESSYHTSVSCDESSAVTGIQVMELSDMPITRVVLTCIRLAKEE